MRFFRCFAFLAICYLAMADYRQEALEQHNAFRAIHNAPRMRLDRGLNSDADRYARKLFDMFGGSGDLKHSPRNSRPGVGENLAAGCTTARGIEGRTVQDAIKAWYDEVCQYNFNRHAYQSGLGHFSQLIWKASTELGIGKYTGRQGRWTCTYIVARYRDTGNVNNERYFRENVERGNFRPSYCRTVGDLSLGDDEYLDAPESTEE